MCTLYNRIQELCKSKGVSGSRMCLDLGMSKSTLSDLKSGRKKGVTADTAQKIASYLGVSVEYLLGEEEQKNTPTPQSEGSPILQEIVSQLDDMTDDQLEKLLSVIELIRS